MSIRSLGPEQSNLCSTMLVVARDIPNPGYIELTTPEYEQSVGSNASLCYWDQ